jgi:hypothetical protein
VFNSLYPQSGAIYIFVLSLFITNVFLILRNIPDITFALFHEDEILKKVLKQRISTYLPVVVPQLSPRALSAETYQPAALFSPCIRLL